MKAIQSYAEFWPHYLREHARPATRAWHYLGTAAAITLMLYIIITGNWLFLPLAFACGYAFAWGSHALIEKNKPATFTYPLWSLFSDFKMLLLFMMGRLEAELIRADVRDV